MRSYAVYMERNRVNHENAAVCMDAGCCLACRTRDELAATYGASAADASFVNASAAVYETAGEIMTFEGAPVLGLFHVSSPEYTESARNVLGVDLPYLQAVENVDESGFAYFKSEKTVQYEAFGELFGIEMNAELAARCSLTYNESGRCVSAQIGEQVVEGETLRQKLGEEGSMIRTVRNVGYLLEKD